MNAQEINSIILGIFEAELAVYPKRVKRRITFWYFMYLVRSHLGVEHSAVLREEFIAKLVAFNSLGLCEFNLETTRLVIHRKIFEEIINEC